MPTPSIALVALAFLGQSLVPAAKASNVPAQAQVIDQRAFNVLETTQPPVQFNAKSVRSRSVICP
jgi:gluconolactonase